jgi:lipopolysaccharide biosynthesis protein
MSKLFDRIIFPFWARMSCFRERVYRLGQKGNAGDALCLYSAFLEDGEGLRPQVYWQLKAYNDLGFTTVLVVTSPVQLNETTRKSICNSIRSDVALILFRPNQGFDFYSWKRGLIRAEKVFGKKPVEVLFTNDSILGPLFDLSRDVSWLQESDERLQLKGLTRSDEIAPHIQSYFLYFNRTLCAKGLLAQWLKRIKAYRTKEDVIGFYEVGGSLFLQEKGVELVERYRLPEKQNPTLFAWKELLQTRQFPFFKKSLFTFHREFLDLAELRRLLAELESRAEVNQDLLKLLRSELQKNLDKHEHT